MVSLIYLLATSDSVFTLSHQSKALRYCSLELVHQLHEMDCLQSSGFSWVALAATVRPAFAHHSRLQRALPLSRYNHTLELYQTFLKSRERPTKYLNGRCVRHRLHARMHKLTTEQETMELHRIPSHDMNPLRSLASTRAKPAKAITKASQQHFPLMKLLPELRIRIYECVFAHLADALTPRSLSTVQNLDDHLRGRLRGFLTLLHASRALRSEAIEVYCLSAKARLAALSKAIQSMYTAIDVLSEVLNWVVLMEAHVRELVIGKLGILLRVIKFVTSNGQDKRGWSFAALRTAMENDDTDRMRCD